MKYKRMLALVLSLVWLCGCTVGERVEDSGDGTVSAVMDYTVEYKATDTDASVESGARHIVLEGDTIQFDGTSSLATVNGSVITITAGGTYVISGTLTDGQIVVNEPKAETVRLVLDGADITCQSGAPIYVQEAKKVVLILVENTENRVTDGLSYATLNEDGEPNAAVFSKADLTVTGGGSLAVTGRYNNGINCKDSLKITGGTLTVDAVGNGIKGKDYVAIADGHITVTAGHDGIKSTNTTDTTVGFVRVDGGVVSIAATQDGVQAERGLLVQGGTLTVQTGGGSVNSSTNSADSEFHWGFWGNQDMSGSNEDATSAKGLKAAAEIAITGGTITLDASDDAIHCNGNIRIEGGCVQAASGDDGVHADNALTIQDGELTLTKAYEGLEALKIAIHGGKVHVTASDDGINAAGGSDSSAMGGRPGENTFLSTEGALVEISGGYVVLNADGDGLDSNDKVVMSGGTVLVWGPTNSGNGALDYASGFTLNGGILVAAGAAGMAESVTDGDAHALFVSCASQESATPLRVTDSDGQALITLVPPKAYGSVVIATPSMQEGAEYTVTIGGSCDGEVVDGVVSGGRYTAGETTGKATLSGVSTSLNLGGSWSGGMGGGQPGGGFAPGGGHGMGGRPR